MDEGKGDLQRRCFFSNASFETNEEVLWEAFGMAGSVVRMEFHCLDDGRFRGKGTVEYSGKEEAQYAAEHLNGMGKNE